MIFQDTLINRKVKRKAFIMFQKFPFLNKCFSFDLSVYQSILKNHVSSKILSSTTVFNINSNIYK